MIELVYAGLALLPVLEVAPVLAGEVGADGADRIARRDRYLALDPQARWQPGIGYDYLADERGLALAPVPPERGWREA